MARSFQNFGNPKVCQLHFVKAAADEDVWRLDLAHGVSMQQIHQASPEFLPSRS